MPPEFALNQEPADGDRHVVAVRGEIDLFTAPELKTALGEAIESGHSRDRRRPLARRRSSTRPPSASSSARSSACAPATAG